MEMGGREVDIGELAESHRRGAFDNQSLDSSPAVRPSRLNRYQLEVAEMDRRHRLAVRWLTLSAAATLVVLSLWSAGLPPTLWLRQLIELVVDRSAPASAPTQSTVPRASTTLQISEQVDSAQVPSPDKTGNAASPSRSLRHEVFPANPVKLVLVEDRLTDAIRPMPSYEGKTLVGLKLIPGQRREIFSRLGLQVGDVITAINGEQVRDAQSAIETLKTLTNGARLVLSLSRGGESTSLAIDGGILAEAAAHTDAKYHDQAMGPN